MDLQADAAEKIVKTKLKGGKPEELYNLADSELIVMRNEMQRGTIELSQVLANKVGLARAARFVTERIEGTEAEAMHFAAEADKSLARKQCPTPEQLAALIVCSFSDQTHIENEIARRESLQ